MKYGIHDKIRSMVGMSVEQMRDKRVDEVAYKEVRKGLGDIGFDVASWEKRDLLQGAVPVVFKGRPYDIKKEGPDITISDGVSNKLVAEIKNATNPGNAKKFLDIVKRYTERLASMYSIVERLRLAATIINGTLAPEMFESMAPELAELLTKKNIIPKEKEKEVEKEILMIMKPGKGWVPSRTALLDPAMFESMKKVAPKLVEHLMKKNLIPPDKKQEALREISRARIPAQHIPKKMP